MNASSTNQFSEIFYCEVGVLDFKHVIWIENFTPEDLNYLKSTVKVRWSQKNKKFYLANTVNHRSLVGLSLADFGRISIQQIQPINQEAYFRMKDMLMLKGYSYNTMRTYLNEFAQLLYVLKDFHVNKLSEEKIKSYLVYCIEVLGLKENQIHSRINAMKFYFEKVLFREKFFVDIPRPKKPSLLPKHLTEDEIQKILSVIENRKHLLIIKLCYGMGLRVSEIAKLKLEHIYSKEHKVLISGAKGKKDRFVFLPHSILSDLKVYYKLYQPKEFLFEGSPSFPLHVRTIQMIFKKAMHKAGIKRNVGIHCLRHSYATHLLQYGTDISHIQKLLGHKDIRTTLNYTKVTDRNLANIVSPLDRLYKNDNQKKD